MKTDELLKALQDENFNKSAERAEELAIELSGIIIEKMEMLDMKTIQGRTRGYEIGEFHSSAGHHAKYLIDNKYGECIGQNGGYLGGDFNCWINGSTRNSNIEFLRNFRSLIEALVAEQERMTKRAEDAIKEAEEIMKQIKPENK